MLSEKAFAEVVESSLFGWQAQSWHWNKFPAFGSLVTAQQANRTIIAVVHQIKTGSIDPVRYPFTYQKTEDELLAEQPQIFEFLKTTFSCLIIGYQENYGKVIYQLSPEPPKIHTFVHNANIDLCKMFFNQSDYLYVLFSLSDQLFNIDELLLAMIKRLSQEQLFSTEKLEKFTDTYALLCGGDYKRIKLFLHRLQALLLT